MDIQDLWSRRNILVGLTAGGATAGAVGVSQFTSASQFAALIRPVENGRRGAKLGTATSGDWALQVGSPFTAETGHVLTLVDVQVFGDNTPRPRNLRDKAFVARFDVKSGGPMQGDRTYRFNHREGGVFEMFLSSVNPNRPERMLAIFN
jgi:hypothetical protein